MGTQSTRRIASVLIVTASVLPVFARALPASASTATPSSESTTDVAPTIFSAPVDTVAGVLSRDVPAGTRKSTRRDSAVTDPRAPAVESSSSVRRDEDVVPGRFIVRIARGRGVTAVSSGLESDGYGVDTIADGPLKFVLVDADPADPTVLTDLLSSDGVADVWPDRRVSVGTTQSDAPWGLDRIDQSSLPLNGTFTYDSDGTGVTAYIIDTGVRGTHQDFGGRVTSGWNGTTDAGNGDSDCNGHGTHVAGTVAGTTYGVAKKATIVPVRVLECSGSGYNSTIISGINWIISNHSAGVPAVINMSLGSSGDSSVDTAVASAVADGIVTVVAAGNDNADACGYSPARAPSAITVGALTNTDAKASYSNHGSCLDIWAPGSDILSADYSADTGGRTLSGTSMASPHVAGAAARLLSFNNSLTVDEVTRILTALTVDAGGRNLLQSPLYSGTTVPAAPTGVTATSRNAAAEFNWTTPVAGVAAYRFAFPDSTNPVLDRSTTTYTKTGLANNVQITVTVSALNAAGWGSTTSVSVTPYDDGTPLAPTVSRVGTGHGWIAADITLPAAPAGGRVTSITLRATPETGDPVTATAAVADGATGVVVRLTGLVPYAAYTVDAQATNAVGGGLWSAATSVTVDAPVTIGRGGSTQVGFAFGTYNLGPQTRLPTVVDDTNGRVFAGVPGGSIVSIERTNHFVATGSISSGQGMFLLHDSSRARTFAIPYNQNTGTLKELSVSGSTVSATAVATTGITVVSAVVDQANDEVILAGSGLKRFGIGSSGSLTSLTVPSLTLGSAYITAVAVHGSKVALVSSNGNWVKVWDRTAGTIVDAGGTVERPGTAVAFASGFLVAPDKGDVLRFYGWDGALLAQRDTFVGSYSGVVTDGLSGELTPATGAAVDADTAVVKMGGDLLSVQVPGLGINAYGSASGTVIDTGNGAVLSDNYLFDLGPDLRSRYRSFAPGAWSNAAENHQRGTTLGSVVVETSDGYGVRLLEPTSTPRNVSVDAADGSARVTWQAPETTNADAKSAWLSGYADRPYTFDVVVQPGDRIIPWSGGPFDLVVDGLDPAVQHSISVRTVSPGGTTTSAPVTVSAAASAARPDPPPAVSTAGAAQGCVDISWNAVTGASAGYRIEILGRASTTTVAAGTVSTQVCGLQIGTSQFPLIRARVVALGATTESVPSVWSAPARPVSATVMLGAPGDADSDQSMGVFAMASFTVDENAQSRNTFVHIAGEDFQRSVPAPANAVDILGFDPVRREVFVGVCSYAPRVVAVAVDDGSVRSVTIPAGPIKICGSRYDPVLRAIWMTNGYWANTDIYSVGGADVFAVSVDTPGQVVRTTRVTCRRDGYSGELWVGDGPLVVADGGRAAVQCMNVDSGSLSYFNWYGATDLATGNVIRESTSWFSLVGATADEGFVTVDDTGTSLHNGTTTVIPFVRSLEWGTLNTKRPTGLNAATWAQATRRDGRHVVAGTRYGHHFVTDITARTSRDVGNFVSAGNNSALGTVTADDNTIVQSQSDGDVSIVSTTGSKLLDPVGKVGSFETVDAGGRRPTSIFSGSVAPTVLPFGPGDTAVISRIRVPDNMGVPTAEDLGAVLVHVRGPARPVITARNADSVSYSATATEGLAPGSSTKWELRFAPTSYEVRDSTGTVRCSSSATTCTAAGRFSGGAAVRSVSTAGGTSAFATGDTVADGITLPAAPRVFPWLTAQSDQAAVWTNALPAGATSSTVTCRGRNGGFSSTATSAGASRTNATPGSYLCRARSESAAGSGPWGTPFLLLSEDSGVRGSGLTGGTGTVTLGGSGSSAACLSGASTLTVLSGQTVTAAEGAWRCVVTKADGTSLARIVWSGATVSAPGPLAVTRSGSTLTVSFAMNGTNAAVESFTVRCTGLAAVTVASSPATVSGATGIGPYSCTVETDHRDPATGSLLATAASAPVSTLAHDLNVTVSGNGTVVSDPAGIDCGGTCSARVSEGLSVSLTATASTGWSLTGWEGAACTGSVCTVTVGADTDVTARFARTHTVGLVQAGNGTVSSVGAIVSTNSSGAQSSTSVATGTVITLTATASTGWELTGWEGAACTGSTCTVTVTGDTSIRAVFTAVAPPATVPETPTVTVPPQNQPSTPVVTAPPASVPTATDTPTTTKLKTVRYVRRIRTKATKLSPTTLASRAGVSYAKGSTFALKISPASARGCRITRNALRRTAASTCRLTLTITGTATRKIVSLTVSRP